MDDLKVLVRSQRLASLRPGQSFESTCSLSLQEVPQCLVKIFIPWRRLRGPLPQSRTQSAPVTDRTSPRNELSARGQRVVVAADRESLAIGPDQRCVCHLLVQFPITRFCSSRCPACRPASRVDLQDWKTRIMRRKHCLVLGQTFGTTPKANPAPQRPPSRLYFGTEFGDAESLDFMAVRFCPETYPLWDTEVSTSPRVSKAGGFAPRHVGLQSAPQEQCKTQVKGHVPHLLAGSCIHPGSLGIYLIVYTSDV